MTGGRTGWNDVRAVVGEQAPIPPKLLKSRASERGGAGWHAPCLKRSRATLDTVVVGACRRRMSVRDGCTCRSANANIRTGDACRS
jgi:hypothetical protein